MIERCAVRSQSNEPVDWQVVDGIIHNIQTCVGHHDLEGRCAVFNSLHGYLLPLCRQYLNLDVQVEAQNQHRVGLIQVSQTRTNGGRLALRATSSCGMGRCDWSDTHSVQLHEGDHTPTLSMGCTWMIKEAMKQHGLRSLLTHHQRICALTNSSMWHQRIVDFADNQQGSSYPFAWPHFAAWWTAVT